MIGQVGEIVRILAEDLRNDRHVAVVGRQEIPHVAGFDPLTAMGGDKGGHSQIDTIKVPGPGGAVFGIGEASEGRQPQKRLYTGGRV